VIKTENQPEQETNRKWMVLTGKGSNGKPEGLWLPSSSSFSNDPYWLTPARNQPAKKKHDIQNPINTNQDREEDEVMEEKESTLASGCDSMVSFLDPHLKQGTPEPRLCLLTLLTQICFRNCHWPTKLSSPSLHLQLEKNHIS
jgi:hypothetical protein